MENDSKIKINDANTLLQYSLIKTYFREPVNFLKLGVLYPT